MKAPVKKVVAATVIAAFTLVGTAIPAEAAAKWSARTVWCC